MRRHDDEIVECPFDKSHKMPYPRLQWHLANKCKAKTAREEMDLPIFHCKHSFLHIYFEKDALEGHENECPCKPKPSLEVERNDKWPKSKTTWDVKSEPTWEIKKQGGWGHELQNRTMPLQNGSGRSWDTTTAEDELSPDEPEEVQEKSKVKICFEP